MHEVGFSPAMGIKDDTLGWRDHQLLPAYPTLEHDTASDGKKNIIRNGALLVVLCLAYVATAAPNKEEVDQQADEQFLYSPYGLARSYGYAAYPTYASAYSYPAYGYKTYSSYPAYTPFYGGYRYY
ncbi:unnamed protein product [Notodromas monacha]|uniref:Uncharacterized protein n=1 Tax=Notodromas monacha TaxID=399045 RepID=A0A7R9BU62_9CRUS|nr:unnamed protein product [Notodromas monacha]CAG0920805.1 unnamed protein product [Notodromas monacha]